MTTSVFILFLLAGVNFLFLANAINKLKKEVRDNQKWVNEIAQEDNDRINQINHQLNNLSKRADLASETIVKLSKFETDAMNSLHGMIEESETKRKKLGDAAFKEINQLREYLNTNKSDLMYLQEKHEKLVGLYGEHLKGYIGLLEEMKENNDTIDNNFTLLDERLLALEKPSVSQPKMKSKKK